MKATGMSDRPRRVSVRAALLSALLLCAGCTLPGGIPLPSGAPAGSDTPAGSASTAAVARDVIAEVNRTRRSNQLNPLIEDAALNRAAREHSEELAARRTLDHNSTNPARRTMTMRIEAAGGTWSRAAENLLNMSGQAADVPSQTVRMWLSSEGHRRNMLSPDYTHTGVGVAIDQRGIWYVTQLYVFPRPVR
ncbi:MAG: CAP domain-containing protein [Longimicrobiales bacterium]